MSDDAVTATKRIRVYKRAVEVFDQQKTIENLLETHMDSMNAIFNPDTKRMQAKMDPDNFLVKRLVAGLKERGELEGRLPGTAVLLQSLPGCRQQQWHRDYDITRLRKMHAKKPCGAILALQDNTKFDSFKHGQYHLDAGDVLVFDGNVVHAGSSYKELNVRVHIYLNTPSYVLQDNVTFPCKRSVNQ